MKLTFVVSLTAACLILATGCTKPQRQPNLADIYNDTAQQMADQRHPVIVIPGILGSKLIQENSSKSVWGAFTYGAADVDKPEGARLFSLPMRHGVPLRQLQDDVVSYEVLDNLTVDIGLLRGLELPAYIDILKTLGVGKYRDQTLGEAGAIDYQNLHYTCFQFPYDWRRDVSEQAIALHAHIMDAIAAQPHEQSHPKVDIIAHSMGGLVLRYYLRYGPTPLPDDGSLPELNWAGAKYVDNAILIGTPSAGSVHALEQLIEGVNFASIITPTFRPAILGTMPSIYQLLPRHRHARIVDAHDMTPIDIYNIDTWINNEWGLASPDQDEVLQWLLPDAQTPEERRRIALDHLSKSLARAKQFHQAMDIPAQPPEGTKIHIVLGDAIATADMIGVEPESGEIEVVATAPGDKTVTRESALMDERVGDTYQPRLRTPIAFDSYLFLSSDHLGLTRDPAFTNYVLFTLLERPHN